MKRVICSGYIPAQIIEDKFEDTVYKKLELQIDKETIERTSLKSPSSYRLLQLTFEEQAKGNKQ